MEWRDQGALLAVRRHGEAAAIIEVFTQAHGRHAGVVRGGAGRRMAPLLQPGAQLDLIWRARLDDHLGVFAAEPVRSRAGLMADRRALAALNAICAMACLALPERAPHPVLYLSTQALLNRLDQPGWEVDYLRWEMLLLEELGFGLDLATCAVTGAADDLAWVSPRTGRAVSRAGAAGWEARLLALPPCLTGGAADAGGIGAGLRLTGHFLGREVAGGRGLPEARARLLAVLGAG